MEQADDAWELLIPYETFVALSLEFKKEETKPATTSTNENSKPEATGFGGFLSWLFGPSKPTAPSQLRFYSPKMALFGAQR